MSGDTFTLGLRTERKVTVTAQSHARIRILLPRVFSSDELTKLVAAFDAEHFDVADISRTMIDITGKAYAVLEVLAPAIREAMPEHEWQGFRSAEALAQGDDAYDPDHDNAPGVEQIINALDVALQVNGLRRIGELVGTARDAADVFGGSSSPPASGPPTTAT